MKVTLDGFIGLIPALAEQLKLSIQAELAKAGDRIVETAQGKIGQLQDGWPDLAASTQMEREREGYAPDEPLLETGALRTAYSSEVGPSKLTVGNTDPIAEYLEIGTASAPPRPVLLPSVYENLDDLKTAIGEASVEALSNKVTQ